MNFELKGERLKSRKFSYGKASSPGVVTESIVWISVDKLSALSWTFDYPWSSPVSSIGCRLYITISSSGTEKMKFFSGS